MWSNVRLKWTNIYHRSLSLCTNMNIYHRSLSLCTNMIMHSNYFSFSSKLILISTCKVFYIFHDQVIDHKFVNVLNLPQPISLSFLINHRLYEYSSIDINIYYQSLCLRFDSFIPCYIVFSFFKKSS